MKSQDSRRLILEATIDGAVIRGTLVAPGGHIREFHGWLELSTAIEAALGAGREDTAAVPAMREQA